MKHENQQWGAEHGMDISGFGVESVELIKGPMSVLYGSDAIGGVLYVNPDSYSNEDMEVEIGSFYNSNYSGFTNNLGVKGNLPRGFTYESVGVDPKEASRIEKKLLGKKKNLKRIVNLLKSF